MARVDIALQDGMHFQAVGEDGVVVSLDSSSEHGGKSLGMRPMEMLLVALGSCTAMDIISILRKKRQQVTDYRIEVSGEQAHGYPQVFTDISLRHILTGIDLSENAVVRAIELSEEKYCPAYAMLSKAASISSTYQIVSAPSD